MRILHVAAARDWRAAQTDGAYRESTRGRTLAQEGFLHASTSAQLGPVLANFYADVPAADLVLLVVDVDALAAAGSPVVWERPPGLDDEFPHIYGPLPVTAVATVLSLVKDPDGSWRWPDLDPYDVARARP